jgi:predicted heme/steroid binding protein
MISINRENGDGFTMTPAELSLMDGRTEDTSIYLAIKGHIYDITSARDMYGPKGSYKLLAARDSTLPFAFGCCEAKCMKEYNGAGKTWFSDTVAMKISEEEEKEVDSWVELYHTHGERAPATTLLPFHHVFHLFLLLKR